MTELKTLKNIERGIGIKSATFTGKIKSESFVMCDELKAEAVKWVKEFREILKTNQIFIDVDKFWMEKFNLTEEDLK